MTRLSRRLQFPLFPLLLLGCLFFPGCSGGSGSPAPQQISPPQIAPVKITVQLVQQGYLKASNTDTGDQVWI